MATLIRTDGVLLDVTPKNKRKFTLKELQSYVGGYIETIDIVDDYIAIVNE